MGVRVSDRVKVIWVPGLGAVALSLLSLHFLPRLFPLAGLVFPSGFRIHYPSFLSLVAIGGLAAYSSRRLGGGVAHRIIASLFPVFWEVLGILIWWVVIAHLPSASDMLFVSMHRLFAPTIALFLGAALFFRDSRRRSVAAQP